MRCRSAVCDAGDRVFSMGSKLGPTIPVDCPARNLEELRVLCRHLLNRGQAADLHRATIHLGPAAAVSTARWRAFQHWVFPTVKEIRDDSFRRCRAIIRARNPSEPGGWECATVAVDTRWQHVGHTSKHGTTNMCCAIGYECKGEGDDGKATLTIPIGSCHMSMTTKGVELELFEKYDGTSKGMDTAGALAVLKEVLNEGMVVRLYRMDGDGKSAAEVGELLRSRDPDAVIQSCCNHRVVNLTGWCIKKLPSSAAARVVCSKVCPNRVKADGQPGKRKACIKATTRWSRFVLAKSIRTWLESKGTPKTKEDVDRIVLEWDRELDSVILSHAFGQCNEHCTHEADWDGKGKSGHVVTCVGQQRAIRDECSTKIGKGLKKLMVPGFAVGSTNAVESLNNINRLHLPKGVNPTAMTYQLSMLLADMHHCERVLWEVHKGETWFELFWRAIADRVGVFWQHLVGGGEIRAAEQQIRERTKRAKRRNTAASRKRKMQSKKKAEKIKLEHQGSAGLEHSHDGEVGGGARKATRKGPTAPGQCKCGPRTHLRTNSMECPLNKKHSAAERRVCQAAAIAEVAGQPAPESQSPPEPAPAGMHNVDKIIDERWRKVGDENVREVRVRWEGCGEGDDTWESAEALPNNVALLEHDKGGGEVSDDEQLLLEQLAADAGSASSGDED